LIRTVRGGDGITVGTIYYLLMRKWDRAPAIIKLRDTAAGNRSHTGHPPYAIPQAVPHHSRLRGGGRHTTNWATDKNTGGAKGHTKKTGGELPIFTKQIGLTKATSNNVHSKQGSP